MICREEENLKSPWKLILYSSWTTTSKFRDVVTLLCSDDDDDDDDDDDAELFSRNGSPPKGVKPYF